MNLLKPDKHFIMKKALLLLLVLAVYSSYAQEKKGNWSVSLGYTFEPLIDGYVYVKEINSVADSLSFNEDLNVSRWHNVSVKVKKTFKSKSSLSLSFEKFFYASTNKLDKNIYYNDLVINGRAGITVSNSYIYRGLLLFEDPVTKWDAKLRLSYLVGLLYDNIIFHISGQVINEGDSVNFRENFNDQVIPSLVLGGKAEWSICQSAHSRITLETFGTYIPSRLMNRLTGATFEYTAINGALGYTYDTGKFFISPKITGRHMHSRNDEERHIFRTTNGGVNLEIGFRF
jgi:hypothetical protein